MKKQTRAVEMKILLTFDTTSTNEAHIAKRSLEIKRKLKCSEHIIQEYIGDLAHHDYGNVRVEFTSGNIPFNLDR
jgi:hypothetical protein